MSESSIETPGGTPSDSQGTGQPAPSPSTGSGYPAGSGQPSAPQAPPRPTAPREPAPVERTPEQELAHWKDMAKKQEDRAKENAGAARRLKAIEDAAKSDLERANDALAQAQKERDDERAERIRIIAASSHGIGNDFLDFLGSGTEDEINGRAERLSNLIKSEAEKLAGTAPNQGQQSAAGAARGMFNGRPAESLRAGAAPATGNVPTNNNDYFRSMFGQSR